MWNIFWSYFDLDSLKDKRSVENVRSESRGMDDNWLANIDIETHAPPHRRLWMGPQFSFKTFQPPGALAGGSPPESGGATIKPHRQDEDTLDLLTEELDLQSLRIQPVRSDPLPTPKSRYVLANPQAKYGENTMIVDNGPESLTDIYSPWPEDVGELSPEKGKLIENIADAMNDTYRQSSECDSDDACVFPPNSPEISDVKTFSSMSPEWSWSDKQKGGAGKLYFLSKITIMASFILDADHLNNNRRKGGGGQLSPNRYL